MKIPKFVKKVTLIILLSITLILIWSELYCTKAISLTLNVDKAFLKEMFKEYYIQYYKDEGQLLESNIEDVASTMANNIVDGEKYAIDGENEPAYGDALIEAYNEAYANSSESDELARRRESLKTAIVNVLGGTSYNDIVVNDVDRVVEYADIDQIDKEHLEEDLENYFHERYNGEADFSDTAQKAIDRYNELIGSNEDSLTYQQKMDYLQQALDEIVEEEGLGGIESDEVLGTTEEEEGESSDSSSSSDGSLIGSIIDGIAGVCFYVIKLFPMIIGKLLLSVIGLAINGVDSLSGIPLDQILFNKISLLDINFFTTVSGGTNANIVNDIRQQVAIWYYAIRNLAAAILAVMVLYVGIRMAISSVADEKARYKRMLADWVVSLVLLFVLHYIMIFIINLNNGIVNILDTAREEVSGGGTIMDDLWNNAMTTISFTEQLGYTVLYFMLAIMSFVFFATYVKRMVTIAFLIMISPLITVTYSLDRMGDGKSQALNTWFKNFVYNILLQPFQCIIYMALVNTAMNTLDAADLSSVVIAIVMVFFLYEAEDIIKEIFHFEGKSVAQTIAQAALVTTAIGTISKAASTGSKVKGYGGNTPSPTGGTPPVPGAGGGTPPIPGAGGGTPPVPGAGGGTPPVPGAGGGTPPIPGAGGGTPPIPGAGSRTTRRGLPAAARNIVGVARAIGDSAPMNMARKFTGAMIGLGVGLGTGNLANAVSSMSGGWNMTKEHLANRSEKEHLHNFAKEYRNTSTVYAGRDNAWIREHTKDLLNGDVEADASEKAYYDAILAEKDRYIQNGFSEDDAITQVEQNVAGIQGGKIGEIGSARQIFYGTILGDREDNIRNVSRRTINGFRRKFNFGR